MFKLKSEEAERGQGFSRKGGRGREELAHWRSRWGLGDQSLASMPRWSARAVWVLNAVKPLRDSRVLVLWLLWIRQWIRRVKSASRSPVRRWAVVREK